MLRFKEMKEEINKIISSHGDVNIESDHQIFKMYSKYQTLLRDEWIMAGLILNEDAVSADATQESLQYYLNNSTLNPDFIAQKKKEFESDETLPKYEFQIAKLCMEFNLFGDMITYWDLRIDEDFFNKSHATFDIFFRDLIETVNYCHTGQSSQSYNMAGELKYTQNACWQLEKSDEYYGYEIGMKQV